MKWMQTACVLSFCFTGLAQDAPPPESSLLEMMEEVIEAVEMHPTAQDKKTVSAALEEPLVLTVRQCVEMAHAENPLVLIAEDDIDAARAREGQARSQLLPQIGGRVGFRHVDELYSSIGAAGLLGGLLATEDLAGKKDSRTDQVSITQVLYAGGQIRAATRASAYLARAEEWRREATLDALEFEAKRAFYDCLLAQALVRVAEESVLTFERHLADAQQMFDVGAVSNFEVLRARTELGARQADAVAAGNRERLAFVNLRRILSLPQDTPVRLAGKLDWQPIDLAVDAYVAQAYENRAEVQALRRAIAAAEEDIRRAKGQYKPRIVASAEWTNVDGGGKVLPNGWAFTVGAEWDLCTGGRRKHEVAEAKAKLRSLEHQLADLERLIELEVRQALIQVEDAIAKITSEKGTLELAREGLRLAELRFQEGYGTQAETLDAELAQTNAETALVQALRVYAVAHAALEKATGRSWVPRAAYAEIVQGAPEP